jgi:hypothetical protein
VAAFATALVAAGSMGFPAHATTTGALSGPAHTVSPMLELGTKYGHAYTAEMAPAGQTPEQRLQWLVNQHVAVGHTPADWTAIARGFTGLAAPQQAALAAPVDLAREVVALDRLAGAKLSARDVAAIEQSAAALPASIRQPFAGLVATVRAAYAAQIPVAKVVNAKLAVANFDPTAPLLTTVQRDAMVARQQAIVAALGAFRAAIAGHVGEIRNDRAAFADPLGLVVLGGSGNDVYSRNPAPFPDPILLVDPDGADNYGTSAGGACPVAPEGDLPPPFLVGGHMMDCDNLVLSVTADLGATSNDVYGYDGPPAAIQGAAGPGALGVLVDVGGDDNYFTKMTRGDVPTFPTTYWDGGSQGFGYGGVGLLLDLTGNDHYEEQVASLQFDSADLSQGFGGGGGVGFAVDGGGTDSWYGLGTGQLINNGFQGIYNNGTGLFGGVGILEEIGGDDYYFSSVTSTTTDYYAQGFGAFGGLGILDELGGNDYYFTQEVATTPFFGPQLNCAYGTASFAGVGIMVDHGGSDYYEGDTNSPSGAHVMDWGWGGPGAAFGAFADLGGDDVYNEHAESSNGVYYGGFGYYEPSVPDPNDPSFFDNLVNAPGGSNVFGLFVDIGGTDAYTSPHDADVKNDNVWTFGVDHA